MDEVGITIIGAGVVGLAIAAEVSKIYDNVVVLERHESFGKDTSSRNSEVIHSGIYYPAGSLKARLCVEGAEMLYRYCTAGSVAFARTGKLIVARDDSEMEGLQELSMNGAANGVSGLRLLGKRDVASMEPAVNAVAALYSPNTGIVDTHILMKRLYNNAESSGALFSFQSEVDHISRDKNGYVVNIKGEDYSLLSRIVVNSAGLFSDRIAGLAGIDIDKEGYRLSFCKGSYFSYMKKSPVTRLIYPLPHQNLTGLGVHATLDLGNRLRFGPDTEYVDSVDYKVDDSKGNSFFESASSIIKGLDRESLVADMAGIRPKIKGEGVRDFVIRHEADKGFEGFINLIGLESPGLTASMAIAKYVSGLIRDMH